MKTTLTLTAILCLLIRGHINAQPGCTDPQANNYNASATVNNGSCTYNTTNLTLTTKASLATPALDENSGIEFTPIGLWTFNDSGNSNAVYRIDSVTGAILQTVVISNATNVDWEDITSNNNYLFIGDFGNNNGDRTNLKIYRIALADLSAVATTATASVINFSYSDQTSFQTLPNNNNFDCESMIFYNDSIHLFSKNWVDKQSRHYVLPATPGTYSAPMLESLNAGYLITGATVQKGGVIALCGYDNAGLAPIYIYMLFDYKAPLFYNGNKRRFNLSSAITHGQVEGISFKNSAYGYISNERFIQSPFNIAPKLKSFNLSSYLPVQFVNPVPVANFIVSEDTICKNTAVQFTDQSTNNPTQWLWTFTGGTPSSSTLQNPVVTYNAGGLYNVSLTATNASGNGSITKSSFIKVNYLPTATITVNGPTNICPGDSTQLSTTAGNNFKYQWMRNSVNISGATNSTYYAKTFGNYKVTVTNKKTNCFKISGAQKITSTCRAGKTVFAETEVYPNPSNSSFELFTEASATPLTLEIFDISGRLIGSQIFDAAEEINFGSDLNPGLYFIRITIAGKQNTIKVIKTL